MLAFNKNKGAEKFSMMSSGYPTRIEASICQAKCISAKKSHRGKRHTYLVITQKTQTLE